MYPVPEKMTGKLEHYSVLLRGACRVGNVLEVSDERIREPAPYEIGNDRTDETNEEEEHKGVVDLSLRELPSRSNNTPDNARRPKDFGRRTNEAVLLVG